MVSYMKTPTFVGAGWIQVPEAKLGPGDEITGWAVKRDLWFFALFAQVHLRIDTELSNVSTTHFCVTGTEARVRHFQRILTRAVKLHNEPRFPNMQVPLVTWEMNVTTLRNVKGRTKP